MTEADCICWVDEKYWFTWMGATEPGSQKEFDPDWPVCGPIYGEDP